MNELENKRVFLICTNSFERSQHYSDWIKKHINHALVFIAIDGSDVLFRMDNYPPDVLILDADLPKKTGLEIVGMVLKSDKLKGASFIITSSLPDQEHFVDDVVIGRVQFLTEMHDEKRFNQCIVKALNQLATGMNNEYRLSFLAADEVLFQEGDVAQSVFIVKRGELVVSKGQGSTQVILGKVKVGEFVGEMAHFNNEPRSATVRATTDCELIEIPRGSLDTLLFTKPSWSKALISNLSARLRTSNDALTSED